jgi:hypothetical protein
MSYFQNMSINNRRRISHELKRGILKATRTCTNDMDMVQFFDWQQRKNLLLHIKRVAASCLQCLGEMSPRVISRAIQCSYPSCHTLPREEFISYHELANLPASYLSQGPFQTALKSSPLSLLDKKYAPECVVTCKRGG